jgi:hypothetical protein
MTSFAANPRGTPAPGASNVAVSSGKQTYPLSLVFEITTRASFAKRSRTSGQSVFASSASVIELHSIVVSTTSSRRSPRIRTG